MTVFILMIVHYIHSQICDALVGSGSSSKPLLPYHRLPWRSHQELVVDADTVMEQSEIEKMNLLIERRAAARWIGDFEVADALRREIATHKFPANIEVVIQDFPRTEGGGSKWKLVCSLENSVDGSLLLEQGVSVLTLAHTALGMAVSKAESQISVNFENELISLVRAAKQQLRHWSEIQRSMERVQPAILPGPSSSMKPNASTSKAWLDSLISNKRPRQSVLDWTSVERNLAGRKAADAAFWFALAGSTDEELFTLLTEVCTKEVEKWGHRQSCRPKDLAAIGTRLAAAGVKRDNKFQVAMQTALQKRADVNIESTIEPMHLHLFDLHSDHCALMIWKFSSRQRKQRIFLRSAAKHWKHKKASHQLHFHTDINGIASDIVWGQMFEDPLRPLVIDVGCGMGISLLGLASENSTSADGVDWSVCNFLGVDLSSVAIGYATAISHRWGINRKVVFMVDDAENLLKMVESYPGPVRMVLVQFPTPYRLVPSQFGDADVFCSKGNSQLPVSPSKGFMVTEALLRRVKTVLCKTDSDASGELLLQSNCEDVAIHMKNVACTSVGFRMLDSGPILESFKGRVPQRTQNWISMNGERALGLGWRQEPVLPTKGQTETEIACRLNQIPVHRCILKVL